jgi:hypothetical protein
MLIQVSQAQLTPQLLTQLAKVELNDLLYDLAVDALFDALYEARL